MNPTSLAEALILYKKYLEQEYPEKTAKQIFDQTLTAFTRYTIREWNGPYPQGRKPTKLETEAAWQFMQGVKLIKLKNADLLQEKVFEEFQVAPSSRYTYRSRLKQFLDWATKQHWWPYAKTKTSKNVAPKHKHGHGDISDKRVTSRTQLKPYSLKLHETPVALQKQLDEFYRFLTQPRWPGRFSSPNKPRVAEFYIVYIRRILGWFYHYARPISEQGKVITYSDDTAIPRIQIEKLTLELLIPKVKIKQVQSNAAALESANAAAEYVDLWICKFLDFLEIERKSQSSKSLINILVAVHALVRFHYYTETSSSKYVDIPVMQKVRHHLKLLNEQLNNRRPVSNVDMQWLDLPDVWQKIVKPLREECRYRSIDGHLRSDQVIAKSFQLFLVWGCLTFRPPRRQQEFRELKISLFCSIKRPKNLKDGQFIHPLPNDRSQDKYHGYLYKAEDGLWYMDMTPESYKTGSTYGSQKLLIPNENFLDTKNFYDYLEAFLYGYYRDKHGNWQSGGQITDQLNEEGYWYSLRMSLEPNHNYIFMRPNTGSAYDPHGFSDLIRTSSHRLTGKILPPHLLRDIFATWFLDQGYTSDRIASLAYAMGHSEEMLRKIYDARKPQQKNRPIEEVMAGLVQQYIN